MVSETARNRSGPSARQNADEGRGVQMVTVGDHAGHQVGACEGDADRAGFAGEQRGHRVAEVGERAGALGHRSRYVVGGGGRVAHAHDDAAGDKVGDDVEGAGKLGGERGQQDAVVA